MLNSLLQKVTDWISRKPQRDQLVIPLIREQPAKIPKSERIILKLRSNPSQTDSQTYEISTYAFDHGSPEEWLHHQEVMRKIFIGQNATTGPQRFALARRFLKGKAKADLEKSVSENDRAETNAQLVLALNDVARGIFPLRAVAMQRRALRRFVRNPAELTTPSSMQDWLS